MAALVVTLCRTPPVHGMLAHTEGMRKACGVFSETAVIFSGHARRAAEHHPFTAPAVRGRREGRDARAEAGGSGRPHTRTAAHAFLSETVSQLSHVLFCDDPLVEIRSA